MRPAPVGLRCRVERIRLHRGQKVVRKDRTRHRLVMCGRRWGKTAFCEDETIKDLIRGRRVGWFIASFKYIDDVWDSIKSKFEGAIKSCNDAKHRLTLLNGAVLEMWSFENSKEVGRGRKYHKIIVDEGGIIGGLMRWWQAVGEPTLMDFGGRAIFVSTPNVIGPDFSDIADLAGTEGWEEWKVFRGSTFDNDFIPLAEREKARARRKRMPLWLWNQEYMGIAADNVAGFFGRQMVRAHIAEHATDPVRRVRLDIPAGHSRDRILSRWDRDAIEVLEDPDRGEWKLWFDGEPDEQHTFCMGVDVGAGVGASNTVISVYNLTTRRKVAEYAEAGVGSESAAEVAMIAGTWFRKALICPEVNGGQGQSFAKKLMRWGYPAIFSQRENGARRDSREVRTTLDVGWCSSPERKVSMLEEYRAALAGEDFINPSEMALQEAITYDYDKSRKLVPFRRDVDPSEETSKKPHGDRVIADGLAWHVALHVGTGRLEKTAPLPPGSDGERFAKRRAELERAARRRRAPV